MQPETTARAGSQRRMRGAQTSPQKPWQQGCRLEGGGVGAVPGEEAGKGEGDTGEKGGSGAVQQVSRQQICTGQGNESVERDLPLDRLRCDAEQKKRPVQRIPGSRLR